MAFSSMKSSPIFVNIKLCSLDTDGGCNTVLFGFTHHWWVGFEVEIKPASIKMMLKLFIIDISLYREPAILIKCSIITNLRDVRV